MTQEEPIKIVIPIEETPVHKPAKNTDTARDQAGKVAKRAAVVAATSAKKAWNTDLRRKATDRLNEGFNVAAAKGTQFVRDRVAETAERQTRDTVNTVQTRVQSGEWREDAKSGFSAGLGWLSAQLAEISQRVSGAEAQQNGGDKPSDAPDANG